MSDHDFSIVDFRAPPPSPVASGRRSFFTNDDVLTHFLDTSLVVPDLVLPDRVFPRQLTIQTPPVIDYNSLVSSQNDSVIDVVRHSISTTGCFQVVNYGIGTWERRECLEVSGGVFGLGPEDKKKLTRAAGVRDYGFEEGEKEMNEEFVWGRYEMLKSDMEGVWPLGYPTFNKKMEALFLELEKLSHKILLAFETHGVVKPQYRSMVKSKGSSMCYIHKQCTNLGGEDWVNSIKYDVIKMLIRGSDYYSHALALHVCDGCSEFHVYSKKGWATFVPAENALVVTIGDQIQAWSDGKYKNVVGRPISKLGENGDHEFISLAFLYSPVADNNQTVLHISLPQQALLAIFLIFLYHFWVYIS